MIALIKGATKRFGLSSLSASVFCFCVFYTAFDLQSSNEFLTCKLSLNQQHKYDSEIVTETSNINLLASRLIHKSGNMSQCDLYLLICGLRNRFELCTNDLIGSNISLRLPAMEAYSCFTNYHLLPYSILLLSIFPIGYHIISSKWLVFSLRVISILFTILWY